MTSLTRVNDSFQTRRPAERSLTESKLPPSPGSETQVFDLFSTPHQEDLAELYSMPNQTAPTFQKPVLLVHGYNSAPTTWKNMRTWFTQNPENIDGGVVSAKNPGAPINKDAKVFLIEYSRPFNSVRTSATELRAVVDRIAAATGSKDIDIVCHSKGGLDTRAYLDQGNDKLDKVVMVATPNHGSPLADIERQFREMGIPLLPSTDDPEVRQAIQDLSEDRTKDGKANNPTLNALNRNLNAQKDAADLLTIAGNGVPTLSSRTLLTFRGDGVVSRKSVQLSGVPNKNIWSPNHFSELSHPDVMTTAADFLVGKALDFKEQEPPVPSDKEIVPQQVAGDTGQVQYTYHTK
jgi:pimeloyl-ACP methyl ester carboxylesterase